MGKDGSTQPHVVSGNDLKIELDIVAHSNIRGANVAVILYDALGYRLVDANTALHDELLDLDQGHEASVEFIFHNLLLKPDTYLVGLWLGQGTYSEDIDGITYVASVSVEPDLTSIQSPVAYPGPYQCGFSHRIHPQVGKETN